MTGLRERKKLETTRAIIHAARALVEAHGVEGVTVEEIAEAAGISPRTFFNYFSCKEEAVVSPDPVTLASLGDELLARPTSETPVEALRAVLIGRGDQATLQRWQMRHELIVQHPRLLPRQLASTAQIEAVLCAALAERTGIDQTHDPRVRAVVAAMLATIRSTVAWWYESDRSRSLADALDQSLTNYLFEGPLGTSR